MVHSFYDSRVPSGENAVVQAQVEALSKAGHEVELVAQRTDDRRARRTYQLEAAATTAFGIGPDPTGSLGKFRPDVVHVHNLFPNFGTRWLGAWEGPVVATMHNFRPMCAASSLYRDGEVCTTCVQGDRWASLKHACYRDSRFATAPLAWRNRRGVTSDAVVARADALVLISERAADVYADAGVPREQIHVVPNFVDPPPAVSHVERSNRWLFAGRITPEKGLTEMLRVWPADVALDIAGDGPDRTGAEAVAPPQVRFLGALDRDELRRGMSSYQGLLFPSRWFEAGATQIYVEALSAGVPTLAVAGNGTSDDITEHDLGAVVELSGRADEVAAAVADIKARREELGSRCVRSYLERFTIDRWVDTIESLYEACASERPVRR